MNYWKNIVFFRHFLWNHGYWYEHVFRSKKGGSNVDFLRSIARNLANLVYMTLLNRIFAVTMSVLEVYVSPRYTMRFPPAVHRMR